MPFRLAWDLCRSCCINRCCIPARVDPFCRPGGQLVDDGTDVLKFARGCFRQAMLAKLAELVKGIL